MKAVCGIGDRNFVRTTTALTVLALGAALVLTQAIVPAAADAYPSIPALAKKACKQKKGKAKQTCIKKKQQQLNRTKGDIGVMTRNVYLGASLTEAINSNSLDSFFRANGEILRDVVENDFPVRAKGLAAEIKAKSPDVVGLQEVALWRIGQPGVIRIKPGSPPESFTTKEVLYDFLDLLMRQLNKGQKRYEVVKVTTEFDFQGPAFFEDPDGIAPDINGRLTMRDVIIAKVGAGVRWSNAQGANYETIFAPLISGVPVTVDRGWNSADFRVRNAPPFRFVNTHLEAFGDDKNRVVDCMTAPAPEYASNQVSIRCQQARELFEAAIGPSTLPVIAVGDFNSDAVSVIDAACPSPENTLGSPPPFNGGLCGDTFAYDALMTLGMRNVSTSDPMSCCLKSDMLAASNGSRSDFDHHIDHILTRQEDRVQMLDSSVTGLKPQNGFWNSDHAGVFSKLRVQG